MSDALAQACAELAPSLAQAAALISQPDIEAHNGGRTPPSSRPPWNTDAAELVHGTIAMLADTIMDFRQQVTGHPGQRPGYRHTGATLKAIAAHETAIAEADAKYAVRAINLAAVRIMQLRAIDTAETDRPVRVRHACPYCSVGDLRMLSRSFRVTCLRLGVCTDTDGQHPRGYLDQSRLDRAWHIYWNDGAVT